MVRKVFFLTLVFFAAYPSAQGNLENFPGQYVEVSQNVNCRKEIQISLKEEGEILFFVEKQIVRRKGTDGVQKASYSQERVYPSVGELWVNWEEEINSRVSRGIQMAEYKNGVFRHTIRRTFWLREITTTYQFVDLNLEVLFYDSIDLSLIHI